MLSTTFAPTKPKNIKINISINSLILKKSTAKKIITKPSKTYFINFYFLKKKKKKKTITIINFNENKTKIIENESKIFINKRKFKTFLTK